MWLSPTDCKSAAKAVGVQLPPSGPFKMKNPCEDDCILRVVCTEECDSKKNYGILLKNAVEQNTYFEVTPMGGRNIRRRTQDCRKYDLMLFQHGTDLIEIRKRRQQKEGQNI
jgi:hypothetical protein